MDITQFKLGLEVESEKLIPNYIEEPTLNWISDEDYEFYSKLYHTDFQKYIDKYGVNEFLNIEHWHFNTVQAHIMLNPSLNKIFFDVNSLDRIKYSNIKSLIKRIAELENCKYEEIIDRLKKDRKDRINKNG